MKYWIDGQFSAPSDILNRGLAYGDGVFETIRLSHGETPLWNYHLERLVHGLQVLGIEMPNTEWLTGVTSEAQIYPESVLKLIAYRAGEAAGYLPNNAEVVLCATVKPLVVAETNPIAIDIATNPLAKIRGLAGIKHLCRLEQVRAAAEAKQRQLDELVMVDEQNHIIEAISSNIFLLINGQWVTPVLEDCGVAGVMRRCILENDLLGSQGCNVRNIPLTELDQVQAAFLSNSVRRVVPIAKIADRVLDVALSQIVINTVNHYFDA